MSRVLFTGGSEWLIKRALERAGRAKAELFVTNVVHCHPAPPYDRPSELHEKANCAEYLRRELALVRPRLIIGLGDDAAASLQNEHPHAPVAEWPPFTPPRMPADGPVLLFMSHPSHMKFRPAPEREEWIASLTAALEWGFQR